MKPRIRWKAIALCILLATALMTGTVVWGLAGTTLRITGMTAVVYTAGEREGEFGTLRALAQQNAVQGTVFDAVIPDEPENYQFVCYRVRLKNNGLLPAEMAEIQLYPSAGDALYYSSGEEITLNPGDEKEVWCVLLTRSDGMKTRSFRVTYYVWGNCMEVRGTHDGV